MHKNVRINLFFKLLEKKRKPENKEKKEEGRKGRRDHRPVSRVDFPPIGEGVVILNAFIEDFDRY